MRNSMSAEARTKVAVMEALTGKIAERLERLAASEERELRGAFSMVPAHVYETTLERLELQRAIRRVRSRRDGLVLVAKADATNEQLAAAAARYREVEDASRVQALPAMRYLRYQNGETTLRYADPHPLTDDRIAPEHDEDLAGALSQEAGFGISGTDASHADAQLATREATAGRQVLASASRPMAADKQRLVQIQLKTGQGFRNARRAQRRYFQKPEKQLERRCRELARRILAEEKARFHEED